MSCENLSLEGIQSAVDHWITTTGRGYFSPLTNMAILAEETGEVARLMARIYGDQTFKESDKGSLGDELADILWVVAAIANQTGVNLTEAFKANLQKKDIRDSKRFSKPE